MRNNRLQVLIGCVMVLLASGCGKSSPQGPGGQSASTSGPQGDSISAFTLVGHADDGRKKWEIQGQTANLLGETVHLSPVSATSFGNVNVHLTAERGQFHREAQDIHLEKDVIATTSDGARLTTDSFDWMAKLETGRTADWVTVTRPGMTVVGKGGIGYPKLKRLRLERQVTVTLKGEKGTTLVTCDGPMEVDYGRRRARFWRNVLVRDAKGFIRSDRMDVALEQETNRMEKATCWGHVEIHHEAQVAFCNRANYWQSPGRTRLLGHPKIVMLPENERMENE